MDLSQFSAPRGATLEINTTVWRSAVLSAGLFQQLPLNNKETFLFEVKALGGIQRIASPEVTIKLSAQDQRFTTTQDSYKSTSFSYLFGAGFVQNFKGSVGLKLSLDYVGSNPEFEDVYTVDGSGWSTKSSFKQEVRILDLGVGLVIGL